MLIFDLFMAPYPNPHLKPTRPTRTIQVEDLTSDLISVVRYTENNGFQPLF